MADRNWWKSDPVDGGDWFAADPVAQDETQPAIPETGTPIIDRALAPEIMPAPPQDLGYGETALRATEAFGRNVASAVGAGMQAVGDRPVRGLNGGINLQRPQEGSAPMVPSLANAGREIAVDQREKAAALRQGIPEGFNAKGVFFDVVSNAPQLAIPAAIGIVNPVAGITTGLAMAGGVSAGNRYDELRNQRGLSPDAAAQGAIFSGAAEVLTEKIPLDYIIKAGNKAGLFNSLKRITVAAGLEGAEEGIVQALEDAYNKGVLGDNITLADALPRIGYASLVGSIMGGAVKGGVEIADALGARGKSGQSQPAPPPASGPPPAARRQADQQIVDEINANGGNAFINSTGRIVVNRPANFAAPPPAAAPTGGLAGAAPPPPGGLAGAGAPPVPPAPVNPVQPADGAVPGPAPAAAAPLDAATTADLAPTSSTSSSVQGVEPAGPDLENFGAEPLPADLVRQQLLAEQGFTEQPDGTMRDAAGAVLELDGKTQAFLQEADDVSAELEAAGRPVTVDAVREQLKKRQRERDLVADRDAVQTPEAQALIDQQLAQSAVGDPVAELQTLADKAKARGDKSTEAAAQDAIKKLREPKDGTVADRGSEGESAVVDGSLDGSAGAGSVGGNVGRIEDAAAGTGATGGAPLAVGNPAVQQPAGVEKNPALVPGFSETRRGEVGGQLSAGEIVTTASGRQTTPFPKIDTSSDRKAGNTFRRVDEWLMQNALAEAEARGDEFNARSFQQDLKNPPQASKDSAEEYLFGDSQPPVLPKILKPLAATAKADDGTAAIDSAPMQDDKPSKRFASITDLPALRKAVQEWAKGWLLKAKRINNPDPRLGEIILSYQGVKHGLSGPSSRAKILSVEMLPDLLKDAQYVKSEGDKKNPKSGDRFHYAEAMATVEGSQYRARLVIRERNDGKKYYDHDLSGLEPGAKSDGAQGTTDQRSPGSVGEGSGPAPVTGAADVTAVDGDGSTVAEPDAPRTDEGSKAEKPATKGPQAPEKPAAPKAPPGLSNLSSDKQAEAQRLIEQLRGKMRPGGQINAGVDPEILALGTRLTMLYIESGVRRFVDVMKAVSDALGFKLSEVRQYARGWYNGARDTLEDQGESIDGMDDSDAVRAALPQLTDEETVPPPEPPADNADRVNVAAVEAFATFLRDGGKFKTIVEARKVYEEKTGRKPTDVELKRVDEAIELAVVIVAKEIVQAKGTPAEKYAKLVDLYARQPNLGTRTSTSVEQQAYSTPAPLAYLASLAARITKNDRVQEPTAGNGMLLIAANKGTAIVNELNPDRLAALQYQGYEPTSLNAATETLVTDGTVDVVITNPPFGTVKDDAGQSTTFKTPYFDTTEIDHAIAFEALGNLAQDGRAVLIVGGLNKQIQGAQNRADAYQKSASKRRFYLELYRHYNVVDHYTVAGELYQRQGAGWPVDVIVIEGRGKSARPLPAVTAPRIYSSWKELEELANETGRVVSGRNAQGDSSGSGTGDAGESVVLGVDGRRGTEDRQAGEADQSESGGSNRGSAAGSGGLERDGERDPAELRDADRGSEPSDAGQARDLQPFKLFPDGGERVLADAFSDGRRAEGTVQRADRVDGRGRVNEAGQVPYKTKATTTSQGLLTPANMAASVEQSLEALEAEHGSIDTFVAERLGYTVPQLGDYFYGEQIDALALAINQIEKGQAFIIGDQTGIGKGRVVAGVIRYALKQGQIPMFFTQKPNLYADIYRDLIDIGSGPDIRALVTNSGFNLPIVVDEEAPDNNISLTSPASKQHTQLMQEIIESGDLGRYNVIFSTYDQMSQPGVASGRVRQQLIERFANRAAIIMDESHEAGGTDAQAARGATPEDGAEPTKTGRAGWFRQILGPAKSVFFSSATYAKRPSVMDLYFRTDMTKAVERASQLGQAISAGGVPLQQFVASMLARAGQYVRRERSFDGVSYDTVPVQVEDITADAVATILSGIVRFDELRAPALTALDRAQRPEGGSAAGNASAGMAGAESANFTALMHNVIAQTLLSMKVKEAVNRAKLALTNGERVVLTLANTMGSFIEEYATQNNLGNGDPVSVSMQDVVMRYLQKSRTVKIKDSNGKVVREVFLTDEQLGAEAVAHFNMVRSLIKGNAQLKGLPISPIDYMHGELQKAGYKTGEVTGRLYGIEYTGDVPRLKVRPATDKSARGKKRTIDDFNNGETKVMILNQSGSTGLSLHSSRTFKNQERRRMILVQPELNIDTHMQMLGRVHRTGQVIPPAYEQLAATIPAEIRPSAILAKKMTMLNANTTGGDKSAFKSSDTPDFVNIYGNEVIYQIMRDNPELHDKLGEPLTFSDETAPANTATKVTGRIPLLPVEEQRQLYEVILAAYNDRIELANATGDNELVATTMDLRARTIGGFTLFEPKDANDSSPFASEARALVVRAKRTSRPMKVGEMMELRREKLNLPAGATERQIQAEGRAQWRRMVRDLDAPFADFRSAMLQKLIDQGKTEEQINQRMDNLVQLSRAFEMRAEQMAPGSPYSIVSPSGMVLYGFLTNIKQKKNSNPKSPSSFEVYFAVADGMRTMKLPMSQIGNSKGQYELMQMDDETVVNAFEEGQSRSRETRVIATGNLLAAQGALRGMRGQYVHYTDSEGNIRQGILMPKNFDLRRFVETMPITLNRDTAMTFFRSTQSVWGRGRDVSIRYDSQKREVKLYVPITKASGLFLDKKLRAIAGRDFVRARGQYEVKLPADQEALQSAIDRLIELGIVFETSTPDERRAAVKAGIPVPTMEQLQQGEDQEDDEADSPGLDMTDDVVERLQNKPSDEFSTETFGYYERPGLPESIDGEPVLFRQYAQSTGNAAKGMTNAEIERGTRDFEAALGRTFGELGIRVSVRPTAKAAFGSDIKAKAGFYPKSKRLVLIASALDGQRDLHETLRHEVLAHYGINLFAPDQKRALLDRLIETRSNPLFDSAWKNIDDRYKDKSEDTKAEELLALFAEKPRGALLKAWDALAAIVMRALRAAKLIEPKRIYLRSEMRDLVQSLASGIKRGAPQRNFPADDSALFSRGPAAAPTWVSPDASKLDDFIHAIQDKNVDLKRALQEMRRNGQSIMDAQDAYTVEELSTSRKAAQIKNFLDTEVAELFKTMQLEGLSLGEFEQYLHARHAQEANAQIAAVNPDEPSMQDGGSGMTNAEAQKILAGLSPAKARSLMRAAQLVDGITAGTRQLLIDSGLEKAETIAEWEATYENYVPLNRDGYEDQASRGTGQGVSVRGSAVKSRMGSKLDVVDILANVVMQRERVITRAENNRVGQSLLGLAITNPNPQFWLPVNPDVKVTPARSRMLRKELVAMGLSPQDADGVAREPYSRHVDPKTGLVHWRINPALRNRDNVISVRVKGKDRFIFFKETDPRAVRMATALKNLDARDMGSLMRTLASVTRFFASINTQFNIIFGQVNFLRDVQAGLLNLGNTPIADKAGEIGKEARRLYVASVKTWFRLDKLQGADLALWQRFRDAGGPTGFRDIFPSSTARTKNIERELDPEWWTKTQWGQVLTAGGVLKMPEEKARQWLSHTFRWISDYNQALENVTRMAAFKVALDNGMTEQQAASLAKNLTANFNRRGAFGQQIGSWYAFFNAGVQGSARIAQALTTLENGKPKLTKYGRNIIMGGVALGVIQALALAGSDDEDPPQFLRERNLILPDLFFGTGKYVSIPMPLGWHVLPNFGRLATELLLRGGERPGEQFFEFMRVAIDGFNPIGSGSLAQVMSPTAADPIVALATNTDWTGRKIAREDFNPLDPTPGFTRGKDSSSVVGEAIAEGINWLTGGTDFTPGAVSPTPDQVDYLAGQLGGGVAREMLKGADVAGTLAKGDTPPLYRVPLLGRFVGSTTGDVNVSAKFYRNLQAINIADNEAKGRVARGESIDAFLKKHPEALLKHTADTIKRDMDKARKQKREKLANGASASEVRPYTERITQLQTLLNQHVENAKQ